MKLSQKGMSLVMMLGLLGVAGGIAYVSSKGLIKANKAVVALDEKLELNGISRSTLAYARYILRERKCFKVDDHTELTKECKLNSAGNLERLLMAESTAAALGKSKGLKGSDLLLRELTLTIPAKAIIAGHPLYGPLNDSKVKVNSIQLKFQSKKKKELGNTSSEMVISALFFDHKKEQIYNAYVKYLLMPRHVNTYAFAVKGGLSLGNDKTNKNQLNSNIEFLSPIFVAGDVSLPKRGTGRSVATGAKFRAIEHGGDLKEGGNLFKAESGLMARWNDDARLGNSFDFGSFKKVASEPAIDYIFSEKVSAAAKDIIETGEKMNQCLDYVKRLTSSAPTYNSRAFAKRKKISSSEYSMELGISKLNQTKEVSINATSQKDNENISKPAVMFVDVFNQRFQLGRNDRFEFKLASLITSKQKASYYLKSHIISEIDKKVLSIYEEKKDKDGYKEKLDNLKITIRKGVEKVMSSDDSCKKITGEDDSGLFGGEGNNCKEAIRSELLSGSEPVSEVSYLYFPHLKSSCKDKYDSDPTQNKIDECTLDYTNKIVQEIENNKEKTDLDSNSEEYHKIYSEAVASVVKDEILFETKDKKTEKGQLNKYSFDFKIKVNKSTNSWKRKNNWSSRLALFDYNKSNDIYIGVYNNRTGNDGKLDYYGGPNAVKNYIGRFRTDRISLDSSKYSTFYKNYDRGDGYRCLSTVGWKCHWLSEEDIDSFKGKQEDMRADCLGDVGKIQDIEASEDVSFLEKSFHSWNFNPKTKLHQFQPGVDTGFDYAKALKRNINLEGGDDIPQNSLYVQASNSKVFHVYSVLDHCRIDESAETFFGFVVCRTFVIEDRTKPLKIFGTVVADRINISPSAKITWGNVYHPNAAVELKKAKILRSMSTDCSLNASVPVWHANPSKKDLDAIKSCQSVEVTEKADPFKWTSFNPECGIVDAKDATTKCKAIDRAYKYREYVIVEGQNENI